MKGINYVCLSGNLGADPELRHTQSGAAVAQLRLATSRKRRRDGELIEETEWTTVKVWDQKAEFAATHLRKGDPIIVQGRLHTEKWLSKDGQPRALTTVVAHELTALPKPTRTESLSAVEPAAQVVPF